MYAQCPCLWLFCLRDKGIAVLWCAANKVLVDLYVGKPTWAVSCWWSKHSEVSFWHFDNKWELIYICLDISHLLLNLSVTRVSISLQSGYSHLGWDCTLAFSKVFTEKGTFHFAVNKNSPSLSASLHVACRSQVVHHCQTPIIVCAGLARVHSDWWGRHHYGAIWCINLGFLCFGDIAALMCTLRRFIPVGVCTPTGRAMSLNPGTLRR